jgi:hypothetical protein
MAVVLDFRKPWLLKCEGMQNAIYHYDLRRFRWEKLKRRNQERLEAFRKDTKND